MGLTEAGMEFVHLRGDAQDAGTLRFMLIPYRLLVCEFKQQRDDENKTKETRTKSLSRHDNETQMEQIRVTFILEEIT